MEEKYPLVTLTVPSRVEYDRLFKKIPDLLEKPTHYNIRKVEEAIFLFLSFLHQSDKYNERYSKSDYYKDILMSEFKKVVGRAAQPAMKLLTSEYNPVVEYRGYSKGLFPRSYRLNQRYTIPNCPGKEVKIKSLLSKNYLTSCQPKPLKKTTLSNKHLDLDYLTKSYSKEIITIDLKVHDYIEAFKKELEKKISKLRNSKKKEALTASIRKELERRETFIYKVKNGEFKAQMSHTNRRINSEITRCNKPLRKYLLLNNNPVAEIDIKNSHPYILSVILNKSFIIKQDKEWSLNNIYQKLYKSISNNSINKNQTNIKTNINSKYIRSKDGNTIKRNKNYIHNEKKQKEKQTNNNNKKSPLYYMSCTFKNEDILHYKSISYEKGFYEFINEKIYNGLETKQFIKKNIMNFFYQKKFRNDNSFINRMRKCFPTLDQFICNVNNQSSNTNLALLLQRAESYLFLEVGITAILRKIPELHFVTVHDSIIVEDKYRNDVKRILETSIKSTTGSPIGIDIKSYEDPILDVGLHAEETWSKINCAYQRLLGKKRFKKKKKKKI